MVLGLLYRLFSALRDACKQNLLFRLRFFAPCAKIRRMSNFARSITRFLDTTNTSASAIERAAGLANGTITKIRSGALPSVEKLEDLLEALNNDAAACDALRAYLLDHTPENFRLRTSVQVAPRETIVNQSAALPFDPTAPDAIDHALEILRTRGHEPRIRKMILSLVDILS